MTAILARPATHWALIALAAVCTAGAAVVTNHPAAAAAPVLAACVIWAVFALPLRVVCTASVFLVLVAASPQDLPAAGLWRSPLELLGTLALSNLNQLTGIGALSFSCVDLLGVALLVRVALQSRRDPAAQLPTAATLALGTAFFATVALGAFGAARGGDLQAAYWQLRQLVWLPVFAWIFLRSFGTADGLGALPKVALWAALAKAVTGIYFYVAICLPRGWDPAYITTHSDTVLFVWACAIVWARWLEAPDGASLRRALWMSAVIGAAIHLNDRRIAWVELGLSFSLLWAMAPGAPTRKRVLRWALVGLPVLLFYVGAGWGSSSALFKPVQALRSMADAKTDSSTRYRVIENYNLIQGFVASPVIGSGFGHPYPLAVPIDDISRDFALYRYIPHNSVLFLLMAGGVLGALALLSPLMVALYFAAAAFHARVDPGSRALALMSQAGIVAFLCQCFGDMGTQSWSTVFIAACSVACAMRLAVVQRAAPATEVIRCS